MKDYHEMQNTVSSKQGCVAIWVVLKNTIRKNILSLKTSFSDNKVGSYKRGKIWKNNSRKEKTWTIAEDNAIKNRKSVKKTTTIALF